MLLTLAAFAQGNIRVSGKVIDSNQETVPGVAVIVKGTNEATITDLDGVYYIEVPSKNSVLSFQCLGYKSQERMVGGDIFIEVILEDDTSELDEATVVSYGKQKKLSVIGSIQNIEPEALQVGTQRSISNNLAGQVSGVIAVKPSGEPGYDNANFWIRGVASFSGNTSPLVLVDGVERSLNNIDPSEIESFSVLKDASASAMYGVRGANGVIIINTKRGKVSAPKVELRGEGFVSTPTKLPEFLGAPEYMALLNELAPAGQKMFTKDQIIKTWEGYDRDLYPDTNWIDAITNDVAYGGRANISVSGGSERVRYSVVGSFYNETGIMARDEALPYDTSSKLSRYNLRANLDIDLTKTTLLRVNIGGYLQELKKANSSTDEVFSKAFETPPFVHPAVYSDGTIPIATAQRHNPWAMATQYGHYTNTRSQIESTFAIEQNLKMITPGLKLRALFSFDAYNEAFVTRAASPNFYSTATKRNDEGQLVHAILSYGSSGLGHSSNANYGNHSTYFEAAATYDNNFDGKHDVNALILYNMRSFNNGDIQPYRTQGIAGRLSYTYDRRYVAEFNFGFNGSENFAKGQRFGFFPSGAIGWVISEEPFFRNVRDKVTKLKLRGSVGTVGNDNIGGNRRFAYITTINGSAPGYNFGYDASTYYGGVSEGEVGITNLTWEKSLKMNIGFELGLFYDLDLQVDAFREIRSNIFMQRNTIPSQAGFLSTPYANFGKVENKGIEAQVTYNKRFNNDISLSARATFTYAHNTIIERDEPESVKGTHRSVTGQSINTLWGLWADGLYTADDFDATGYLKEGLPIPKLSSQYPRPGDIKYIDKNNDGYITNEDEGFIGGTTTPEIIYGFGSTLKFYGFDFSFFFQGSGRMYRVIGGSDYFIPGSGQGVLGNCYANYNDRWTEKNPSQNVFWPRLSQTTNPHNNVSSTWWRKDMSFLRCKTIELGYSLPEDLTMKAKMSLVRFYISINNPFYFSQFKLWDPELDTNDGLRYPSMRSAMLGVNINF